MTEPDRRGGAAAKNVRIARLEKASDFAAFAFARSRPRLAALEAPSIAIGAWWRGAPVGLALGTVEPGKSAWLESVMVAAPLRRQGVAGALLAALEEEARSAGAARIGTQYSSFLAARSGLEALLASRGWSPPAMIDIILVGLAGAMADGGGAWRPVQRAMRELTDYSVGRYDVGNARDDAAIGALLAAAPELGVPDPRTNTPIDPEISVMIRHRGALIGWVVGERLTRSIGSGTLVPEAPSILYSGARLADGHHKALMLVGYYRAFSRQAEIHGPASRAVYRTHPGAAAMYTFTRARFEPMALHVEERFAASLTLTAKVSQTGLSHA